MKFDDIIGILGEFGPYQKRLYHIMCIPAISNGMIVLVTVFVLSIPDHRCRLPSEYNDTSYQPNSYINQLYVNHSIPMDDDGKWSQCQRYDVNMTDITEESVININASKTECTEWVYDTSVFRDTFITEQNMICGDKVFRSHGNMIYFVGRLVGSFGFGILSDVLGRKFALVSSIFIHIIGSFGGAFASSVYVYASFRFLTGVSNTFMMAFVIGMEFVGPSKRKIVGIVIEFYWCLGLFILCMLAYFIRDWSNLQLAVAIPTVLLIGIIWFVPESPRWLVSRGHTKKAEKILREAARVNNVELPDKLFDVDTLDDSRQGKVWEMFTSPVLVLRSLIIFFNWMVVSMVYYGLSLNVGNLGGDIYLNFTVASVVEFLGYLSCMVLLDRMGRKALHCASMLLAGTACLCTIFPVLYGHSTHDWITITLSMIGKFGVSAAFGVIYVFSAELFPTVVRTSGMGASSFAARIGGILSPYIADLGTISNGDLAKALPLLVFGGASIAAGLLSLCLPETLNKHLPETVNDAKHFGRKNTNTKYTVATITADTNTKPEEMFEMKDKAF